MRPTGAGDRPVPSWDGKTCVGVFCASPRPGAQSRWGESWRGSGKVGAFPGGLVVEQHSRRAGAGSAPGMSPGTFSAPGRPPLLGAEVAPLGAATVSPGRARTRHCPCPAAADPAGMGGFTPCCQGWWGARGQHWPHQGPRCCLAAPHDLWDGDVCAQSLQSL